MTEKSSSNGQSIFGTSSISFGKKKGVRANTIDAVPFSDRVAALSPAVRMRTDGRRAGKRRRTQRGAAIETDVKDGGRKKSG